MLLARKPLLIPLVLLVIVVATLSFFRKGSDEPEKIASNEITEVVPSFERPRPNVTSIAQSALAKDDYDEQERNYPFPWAFPPINSGIGTCSDPYFTLEQAPIDDHVYRKEDVLAIGIGYRAEGCKEMIVTIAGRHHKGSPFFEHWCEDVVHEELNQPFYDCGQTERSHMGRKAVLVEPEGVAWFQVSGEPSNDPGILPFSEKDGSVEGFELCTLVISVNDGTPDGGGSHQQVNLRYCEHDT